MSGLRCKTGPQDQEVVESSAEARRGRDSGRDLENPVARLADRATRRFIVVFLAARFALAQAEEGLGPIVKPRQSLAKDCLLRGQFFDLMYLYRKVAS